jgi:hypothetical protein
VTSIIKTPPTHIIRRENWEIIAVIYKKNKKVVWEGINTVLKVKTGDIFLVKIESGNK